MTEDRSPMSMPISRVGVATSTLGAPGASEDDLNWVSISARSAACRSPVCSRATTDRLSREW